MLFDCEVHLTHKKFQALSYHTDDRRHRVGCLSYVARPPRYIIIAVLKRWNYESGTLFFFIWKLIHVSIKPRGLLFSITNCCALSVDFFK